MENIYINDVPNEALDLLIKTYNDNVKEYNECLEVISDLQDKNSFLMKKRLRYYKKCNRKYYKL